MSNVGTRRRGNSRPGVSDRPDLPVGTGQSIANLAAWVDQRRIGNYLATQRHPGAMIGINVYRRDNSVSHVGIAVNIDFVRCDDLAVVVQVDIVTDIQQHRALLSKDLAVVNTPWSIQVVTR